MANYHKARPEDEWPLQLSHGQLGEPVGCYRNPGPGGAVIGVFADGLARREGGRSVELRFSDVAEVELPSGKESECLSLRLRDGRQLKLPVKGQRGPFFDSMEMLRFLDRVMHDVRPQDPENE